MKKNFRLALLMVAGAALVALFVSRVGLFSGKPVSVQEKKPALQGLVALEQLKEDGQYQSLQTAVKLARYSVSRTAHSPLGGAAWRAPNPTAGYDAYVTEAGVNIAINDESKSSLSLSLHSFGYGSDLQPVGSGEVSGTGQTIQVRRTGILQEWYVNGPDGLEQGFTLSDPPKYVVPPQGGTTYPLRVALKVSDGWQAVAGDDAKQVDLRGPGGQTVQYGKLVVRDKPGRNIPARLTVANAQVVIEVEDTHAEYPLTIDPLFTLQRRLTASDPKTQDFFGYSVAVDGNTALVGAPYDDVDHQDQGSAYVFVRNGTTWTEQAHLKAADGANLDLFGWVVALDGDTAIVGAYNGPGTAGADQGAAYVFVRQGTSWSQQARLNASDGVAAGNFGTVLALNGDTALVGAPSYRVNQVLAPGAAYVFVRNGVAWTEQARLTANDGEDSDNFGAAVAVEDGTAFIGAPADDVGNNLNQGSVYVFTRNGVLWGARQKLNGTIPEANDFFGNSIAIDGTTALVAAYLKYNDDTGLVHVFERRPQGWEETNRIGASRVASQHFGVSVALSGDRAVIGASLGLFDPSVDQRSAYVFMRRGSTFFQVRQFGPGLGTAEDRFGFAVAFDGDTLFVGAFKSDVTAADQGAAYAFGLHDSKHDEQPKLVAIDGDEVDFLGDSAALSGDTLVVGAGGDNIGDNSNQGSVYVFTRNATVWTFQQKISAEDGAASDEFGGAVAIDGDTLVVGAQYDDVDGNSDLGSAYVFTRSGTVWTFQQKLKNIEAVNANDNFGCAVSLSGETVLVGAPGVSNSKGAAYVFIRNGTVWTQQTKLNASDGASGDDFARSVSLSGNTAVIGAPFDTVDMKGSQGSAYVFTRTGTVWTERRKLTANDGAADDRFGRAVAVSNDTVVVGAVYDTIGANTRQGSAYVFTRQGTNWAFIQKISASDGAADDRFGNSVAISDNNIVVGSEYDATTTNSDQGSAYVFTYIGIWHQQQKLTAGDGAKQDYFGHSVAISGDLVAVGASGDDIGENSSQGSAYVFVAPACALTLSPDRLHNGVVGVSYREQLSSSGGSNQDEYNYVLTGGTLPTGLQLSGIQVLGTPTTPGTYRFTITSTHALSMCTVSREYTVTITATCPVITINPATLPSGRVSVPYSVPLIVTGAEAPYTLTLDNPNSLPPGVSFVNGVLAGTPTQAGTFSFMVSLKDVNGCLSSKSYSVRIDPVCNIMPVTLPAAYQEKPYNTTLTATGGTGAYNFEVASGALPPGLSLSPGGVLSGTPTQPGNFSFSITATASGCQGTRNYTLGVGCLAVTIKPAFLVEGRLGEPYSETLTASGGAEPYRYTVSGQLPPGLTLSLEGVISGTPTQAGRFEFAVYAQDNGVCVAVQGFKIEVIGSCRYSLTPSELLLPASGYSTEVTVTASEGCGWTVTGNPSWLTITNGANGTGTGQFMYTVAENKGASRQAMLTVAAETHFVRQAAADVETPRIDRLAPNSVRMGTDGLILDVIGSGFTAGQVVQWNGSNIGTSFESATRLRALVPSALLSSEGSATVMVVNAANDTQSNPDKFRVIGAVAHTSAASYDPISLAPDSLVAAFGANLATVVRAAETLPLPTELAGTTVTVRDSQGTSRLASLLFVSPNQVNYVMPSGLADGIANITIKNGDGLAVESVSEISAVAPGLFAADSTGKGAAAAFVVRVRENGEQIYEPVWRYNAETQTFVLLPISLRNSTEQVYLILFATGIRHLTALQDVTVKVAETEMPAIFAGPAPRFEGLDQLNVLLPPGLRGYGEQSVLLRVKDKTTNAVKVLLQ